MTLGTCRLAVALFVPRLYSDPPPAAEEGGQGKVAWFSYCRSGEQRILTHDRPSVAAI
jgi:hypothetical protein